MVFGLGKKKEDTTPASPDYNPAEEAKESTQADIKKVKESRLANLRKLAAKGEMRADKETVDEMNRLGIDPTKVEADSEESKKFYEGLFAAEEAEKKRIAEEKNQPPPERPVIPMQRNPRRRERYEVQRMDKDYVLMPWNKTVPLSKLQRLAQEEGELTGKYQELFGSKAGLQQWLSQRGEGQEGTSISFGLASGGMAEPISEAAPGQPATSLRRKTAEEIALESQIPKGPSLDEALERGASMREKETQMTAYDALTKRSAFEEEFGEKEPRSPLEEEFGRDLGDAYREEFEARPYRGTWSEMRDSGKRWSPARGELAGKDLLVNPYAPRPKQKMREDISPSSQFFRGAVSSKPGEGEAPERPFAVRVSNFMTELKGRVMGAESPALGRIATDMKSPFSRGARSPYLQEADEVEMEIRDLERRRSPQMGERSLSFSEKEEIDRRIGQLRDKKESLINKFIATPVQQQVAARARQAAPIVGGVAGSIVSSLASSVDKAGRGMASSFFTEYEKIKEPDVYRIRIDNAIEAAKARGDRIEVAKLQEKLQQYNATPRVYKRDQERFIMAQADKHPADKLVELRAFRKQYERTSPSLTTRILGGPAQEASEDAKLARLGLYVKSIRTNDKGEIIGRSYGVMTSKERAARYGAESGPFASVRRGISNLQTGVGSFGLPLVGSSGPAFGPSIDFRGFGPSLDAQRREPQYDQYGGGGYRGISFLGPDLDLGGSRGPGFDFSFGGPNIVSSLFGSSEERPQYTRMSSQQQRMLAQQDRRQQGQMQLLSEAQERYGSRISDEDEDGRKGRWPRAPRGYWEFNTDIAGLYR